LRLDGPGDAIVGLCLLQGKVFSDFIAGIRVGSYGTLPPSGVIDLVQGFTRDFAEKDNYSFNLGARLADYQPGTAIDIDWSIDQSSRTFTASTGGRPPQSVSFPTVSQGVATTPIQQISLWVWVQRPQPDTRLFVDKFYAR
jgi:hypothetical protein